MVDVPAQNVVEPAVRLTIGLFTTFSEIEDDPVHPLVLVPVTV
jgi:hypothetical protein